MNTRKMVEGALRANATTEADIVPIHHTPGSSVAGLPICDPALRLGMFTTWLPMVTCNACLAGVCDDIETDCIGECRPGASRIIVDTLALDCDTTAACSSPASTEPPLLPSEAFSIASVRGWRRL